MTRLPCVHRPSTALWVQAEPDKRVCALDHIDTLKSVCQHPRSEIEFAMLWIAIGATVAVGVLALCIVLARRSGDDLGSVSARWIAEHRSDAPTVRG